MPTHWSSIKQNLEATDDVEALRDQERFCVRSNCGFFVETSETTDQKLQDWLDNLEQLREPPDTYVLPDKAYIRKTQAGVVARQYYMDIGIDFPYTVTLQCHNVLGGDEGTLALRDALLEVASFLERENFRFEYLDLLGRQAYIAYQKKH